MSATNCLVQFALLLGAIVVLNCTALPDRTPFRDSVEHEGTAGERRRVKRQVTLTQYPGVNSARYMGLDPYEERLLIILLGSSIAILFAIAILIICCRTYRIDRKTMGDAAGVGLFQHQQQRQQQMMMMYGGQAGRQAYYATGHQPGVAMDPSYLDPSKAGFQAGGMPPPQPQQQQQQLVDNTVYASLGGFDRPHSQQQRI